MDSSLLEKLRKSRDLITGGKSDSDFLTVYVGVYNGLDFLPEVRSFLEESYWDGFKLIVVDNASSDKSWNEIKTWVNFLKMPFTLVRNPINLGGGGSFELNRDLLKTKWVTFIHQDDLYSKIHLEVLSNAAKSAKSEVIAISTEMGSMDVTGNEKFSTPRPIWLLKDKSPISYFLANLKTHLVPWGSTIFRTREFLSVDLAWHSTAFPDTEMVLKMSALGDFVNLPVQTMLYRENPISESHGLGNPEKQFASVAALSRVFASSNFIKLAHGVPASRREDFLSDLKKGIRNRVQDDGLIKIVELIVEESLLIAWSYDEPNLIQSVSLKYENFGADRVTSLFDRILKFQYEIEGKSMTIDEENVNQVFKAEKVEVAKKGFFLDLIIKNFPYKYRRLILKFLLRIKILISKNHPHKFSW